MAETKVDQLRREWQTVQDSLDPGEDGIDRMLADMATTEAGWHRVRGFAHSNFETGERAYGWSYFPDVPNPPAGSAEQRELEDAWERKSLSMHAAQRPILLGPKPMGNVIAARSERLRRSD